MKKPSDRHRSSALRRFERAMADSASLLNDVLGDVPLGIRSDDFFVVELGHMIEDGEPSLDDPEFRFLIEQGVRIHVSPNIELRARLVARLRRASPAMPPAIRSVAMHVVGALEDVNFPLGKVGAIARSYTHQLFESLDETPDTSIAQADAAALIGEWRERSLDRSALIEQLRKLGHGVVPVVADTLFESLDDPAVVKTMLELLGSLPSPLAARVLTFLIAEPVLDEDQEAEAVAILRDFWPMPQPYMYFRLRQHSHEDIPFRWLELLIDMDDPRAVDRILEEVVAHARQTTQREDLLAILPLLDRANDPGTVGKLLRLMTADALAGEALEIVQVWLENSTHSKIVSEELERWKNGEKILVRQNEDFNAFAGGGAGKNAERLNAEWNAAYHESLGWQQRTRFPRGPIESSLERKLDEAMLGRLSLNPRLDEATLRDQVESFREDWLLTPQDGTVPLAAICKERRRDTPWLEETYLNEINNWYIKAAQYFDEGDRARARHYLDVILDIEPDYPLARVLDEAIRASSEEGSLSGQ